MISNIIFKFIIIFLIILIINSSIGSKTQIFNRVCLCTVVKEENKYIREFVELYKIYDIDRIYIFDNNDKNGEKFEEVINDYIKIGFVELIDFKEISQPQLLAYNECYRRYNKFYDWLLFFDTDNNKLYYENKPVKE